MRHDREQMKLFANIHNASGHVAGWRHPESTLGRPIRLEYFRKLAEIAEWGKLDAVFFADTVGFRKVEGREAFSRSSWAGRLEPLSILAALSAVTSRIGLVATTSTSFSEPYNVARKFATLDHLSDGRAGWNVVTSSGENEAHNFNLAVHYDHEFRYERAEEFVDVVTRLWDSWEEDGFPFDKDSGVYADPGKFHALDHAGRHFSVRGPLNVIRPPQGHPVIVQAGASAAGRRLAAKTADAVFSGHPRLDGAQAYYAALKAEVVRFGRSAGSLKILPGFYPVIGRTEQEARARYAELDELIHPDLAISMLQMALGGVDLSGYSPDGPLPELPPTNGTQSTQSILAEFARDGGLTIRQLAVRVCVGLGTTLMIAGTPEQIADKMEEWFLGEAADGFVLTVPYFPGGLADFVDLVVPILQRRGLFRTEYEGTTLREHLGVPKPANRFHAQPGLHAEPEIWGHGSREHGLARP